MLTEEEAQAIIKEVKEHVDQAVEFAINSPLPDAENAFVGNFVEE